MLIRSAVIRSTLVIPLTALTATILAIPCAGTATAAAVRASAPAKLSACGPWTAQARSADVLLYAVHAVSRRDVLAAGESLTGTLGPLAFRWNGHAWLQPPQPVFSYGAIEGISANSANNAWAVGSHAYPQQTLIEHWDGSQFSLVPSPSPGRTPGVNILAGVAATSARNAWAVGFYSFLGPDSTLTLIEHWNGYAWRQVRSPNPAPGKPGGSPPVANALRGVAAISGTDAWAVGFNTSTGIQSKTLIVHWNGRTWKHVVSPNPSHSSQLTAVAATSARNAWAVGSYYDGRGGQTLIEHWNGHAWTRVASPDPAGFWHANNLTGVTAVSARDAWAVGWYRHHAVTRTLILHWNGRSWKRVASPDPDGPGGGDALNAISASSGTNVWAVGAGFGSAGHQSLTLRC